MPRILSILLLCTTMYAGTPAEDWRDMSQAQRDFALELIKWGGNEWESPMGHTLGCLAWMESSLGADVNHDEDSYGPYGVSFVTALTVIEQTGLSTLSGLSPSRLRKFLAKDSDSLRRLVLTIYGKNEDYIRQWHRNRGQTINDRRAWQLAAQVYPGGTNWQNRAEYGRVFRQRVKFLRTLTKE